MFSHVKQGFHIKKRVKEYNLATLMYGKSKYSYMDGLCSYMDGSKLYFQNKGLGLRGRQRVSAHFTELKEPIESSFKTFERTVTAWR
jgi:hypothetical protein